MNPEPVDDFLSQLRQLDEERYALVERVRQLIHSVDKGVSEECRYGGLLFTARSPFCGVFSYENHVALEFSRGATLPDPHQVLEGSGKHRRHIKLLKVGDLFKKNVREYLVAAVAATRAAPGRKPPPDAAR